MNKPSIVDNPNPVMKKNSEPHSFFRSSSFLKFLVLLLFLWTAFFAYWFSIHKNEHRDRLERFVQQSLALQKSGTSGDEQSPRQMIVELLEPNTLILKELATWDRWMAFWLHIGLTVQMLLVVAVSILLCRHFVPKDSAPSPEELADKRKKMPTKFERLIFILPYTTLFLSDGLRSEPWQNDLRRVKLDWDFYLILYAETYESWPQFFSLLWPNTFAESFDDGFGAGFVGWIVVVQLLITVILCSPLYFKTEPETHIPDDALGPGERVLRFPKESERKTLDRWL